MSKEKREQLIAQCKAVAHMAEAIAGVHKDLVTFYETAGGDSLIDMVGGLTHHRMETLGNMLNGMDAVEPENDDWIAPVFNKARELFPIFASLRSARDE